MQFNYKLIFYIFLFHIIDTYTGCNQKNIKNIFTNIKIYNIMVKEKWEVNYYNRLENESSFLK